MNTDKFDPTISTTREQRVRSASRERREQAKLELRETILNEAADLFLEQGYDRFSLRQLAERIGYSATTIYLYFQNKDDLLFEVVYEGFRRFSEEMLAALDQPCDPLERLQRVGRMYVEFGIANPAYYHMMFVERTDFLQRERPHGEGKAVDLLLRLEQAVQQAIDAGEIRPCDPRACADALWAAVHGIVALGTCGPMFDPERRKAAIEATLSMAFDGLRPR